MNTALLSYKEVSEITKIPMNTLYTLVREKRIPHKRFGNRFVRFDESEVRLWITEHSVQPTAPVSKKTKSKKK